MTTEYIPTGANDAWPSLGLMRAGYLPATPVNPTIAISIRTLDLYYSLI